MWSLRVIPCDKFVNVFEFVYLLLHGSKEPLNFTVRLRMVNPSKYLPYLVLRKSNFERCHTLHPRLEFNSIELRAPVRENTCRLTPPSNRLLQHLHSMLRGSVGEHC